MKKTIILSILLSLSLNASEKTRDYFNEDLNVDDGHQAFVENKYEKSKEIWTKLCDENDGKSCTNLAWLLDNGLGVEVDKEEALKLYKKRL